MTANDIAHAIRELRPDTFETWTLTLALSNAWRHDINCPGERFAATALDDAADRLQDCVDAQEARREAA